jgi:hypothetical protein
MAHPSHPPHTSEMSQIPQARTLRKRGNFQRIRLDMECVKEGIISKLAWNASG